MYATKYYILFDLDTYANIGNTADTMPGVVLVSTDPKDIYNYVIYDWGHDPEEFPDFETLYKAMKDDPYEFDAFIYIAGSVIV